MDIWKDYLKEAFHSETYRFSDSQQPGGSTQGDLLPRGNYISNDFFLGNSSRKITWINTGQ